MSGTPSDPTYSVYDEHHHLIGRYGAAAPSTSSHEFVYLGDMPIAVFAPGSSTPWNVFSDHLGTPVSVAPTNGPARWKWENKGPFGEYLPDENPSGAGAYAFPLRFPGQQYDAESQLHYNYFRDYDPATGRYIQADPIGLAGGTNPYSYVRGNPVSRTDPLGLADCYFSVSGGRLLCIPWDQNANSSVNIPVASGNNGGNSSCKNNRECDDKVRRGPIPQGEWKWNDSYTAKPGGRVLEPYGETVTYGRDLFRSHSCANPFGPSRTAPYCSEGCVTGTAGDIQSLNRLLDAEPGSVLHVQP